MPNRPVFAEFRKPSDCSQDLRQLQDQNADSRACSAWQRIAAELAMVLALTSELVAKAHREVADSGPSAGVTYLQDDDFRLWIDHVLEGWDQDAGFWVFAYGSLI